MRRALLYPLELFALLLRQRQRSLGRNRRRVRGSVPCARSLASAAFGACAFSREGGACDRPTGRAELPRALRQRGTAHAATSRCNDWRFGIAATTAARGAFSRRGLRLPHRFYELRRRDASRVVALTLELHEIVAHEQSALGQLPFQNARWSIVETSFATGIELAFHRVRVRRLPISPGPSDRR